ncbi:Two-component response regulator-like aprr2 [Asimina triloba]
MFKLSYFAEMTKIPMVSGEVQAEEVIDKVVKEVISQPWLPLPLGLKPPSMESVVSELHRQGIRIIPPNSNSTSCSS